MVMYSKVFKVLIVGTLMTLGSVALATSALVDAGDEILYLELSNQQIEECVVNYSERNCRLYNSRRVRVSVYAVMTPVDSVPVTTQGVSRNIGRDEVVLGRDGYIYYIRDVFEDGSIAAYRSNVNPISSNRVNGNIVPDENRSTFIFDVENIQAVQVRCFMDICTDQRYQEIAGAPLCDLSALRNTEVQEGVVVGVPANLACRVDWSAPIHVVFSDGTLANGNRLFNPFPPTINRYYRVTESDEWSPDETDTVL